MNMTTLRPGVEYMFEGEGLGPVAHGISTNLCAMRTLGLHKFEIRSYW